MNESTATASQVSPELLSDGAHRAVATSVADVRDLVSAVIAVRNEERHIESALTSLLRQEATDLDFEFIVVDGDSDDRTQEIVRSVAARDPRVKLAINKHRATPYAFNIGLQEAHGDYVCILGAHSIYAPDYISTCLAELRRTGAAGCSGREWVRASGEGLQGRLVAWALGHPFGTSTGSMRTRGAGFADSIPYPVFLKRALVEVGGYDVQLHRNQDNDLCQKLRARGYTLYMTDRTCCEYLVSPDLGSLSRYAHKTGFWNFISLRVNAASMAPRHFVPALFVTSAMLGLLMFLASFGVPPQAGPAMRAPLLLLVASYGLASFASACQIALKQRDPQALLLPFCFLVLHVSYGLGTLVAMIKNARPPTVAPSPP